MWCNKLYFFGIFPYTSKCGPNQTCLIIPQKFLNCTLSSKFGAFSIIINNGANTKLPKIECLRFDGCLEL
jgi:hypothetical protein